MKYGVIYRLVANNSTLWSADFTVPVQRLYQAIATWGAITRGNQGNQSKGERRITACSAVNCSSH